MPHAQDGMTRYFFASPAVKRFTPWMGIHIIGYTYNIEVNNAEICSFVYVIHFLHLKLIFTYIVETYHLWPLLHIKNATAAFFRVAL